MSIVKYTDEPRLVTILFKGCSGLIPGEATLWLEGSWRFGHGSALLTPDQCSAIGLQEKNSAVGGLFLSLPWGPSRGLTVGVIKPGP